MKRYFVILKSSIERPRRYSYATLEQAEYAASEVCRCGAQHIYQGLLPAVYYTASIE